MDGSQSIFGDSLLGNKPPKASEMQRSERPGDRLTIEEMRLDLCSRIGPYRVHAGKSTIFTLIETQTQQIAIGRGFNKVPTFVRVEPLAEDDPFYLVLSTQALGGRSEDQTSTLAGNMDVILLAGETLFATAFDLGTQPVPGQVRIKVTEVTV